MCLFVLRVYDLLDMYVPTARCLHHHKQHWVVGMANSLVSDRHRVLDSIVEGIVTLLLLLLLL